MPVLRPPRLVLLGSLSLLAAGGCAPDAVPTDMDAVRGGSLHDAGYIEGHYEARIASMLDGTSRTSHHVRLPDGEIFELAVDEGFEQLEYESFVRVPGGLHSDGRWEADDVVVLAPPPQPIIDPEFRAPRRIGTVIVFWEGSSSLPNGEADSRMYDAPNSSNVYYGENSYGIETLAGKVYGPYEIDDPGGCNENLIANRAEAAMIEKGHDPTQFRQMMFYFPGGTGCGWAGLASVGTPDNPARNSWYHGSFGCTTRNQEIGHNYGMGHSHAYSCPAVPDGMDHNLYEDCSHIEYGHPYDPMGNGCGHMNVVQKTFMGWIEGCNIVTATSDGIFNLMPTEVPCDGTQALLFPAYDGRYYHLEYRNGDGEFAVGGGVLINIAPQVAGFGPTGYVLDEAGDIGNGYLHEGESFTDPGSGNTFTVLEEYDTHVVIQLTLENGGDGQGPTCRDGGTPGMGDGNIGTLSCADGPYPADDAPPEVSLTYPANGDEFATGSDFTITGEATDDREIIEVALYLAEDPAELGGAPFDVKTEPPWEWEATNIQAGDYVFAMVARDARNLAQSEIVSITVTDEAPMPTSDTGGDTTGDGTLDGTTTNDVPDDTDTDTDATAGIDDDPSGCACRSGHSGAGGTGGVGFTLMVLGLGWMRRRRSA